jgi:hypothetical protein
VLVAVAAEPLGGRLRLLLAHLASSGCGKTGKPTAYAGPVLAVKPCRKTYGPELAHAAWPAHRAGR